MIWRSPSLKLNHEMGDVGSKTTFTFGDLRWLYHVTVTRNEWGARSDGGRCHFYHVATSTTLGRERRAVRAGGGIDGAEVLYDPRTGCS